MPSLSHRRLSGFPLAMVLLPALCAADQAVTLGNPSQQWPSEVPGFTKAKPGEHPRLFFRAADIPRLREKAKTPEGQAIIKRLRTLLNGGDELTPASKWTMSNVAGYGFLYVLTDDKKYAELAKQCMEQSFAGTKDWEDSRYAFKGPDGALRAGPALGWAALGYDLCYNGWDEAYRTKVLNALQNYNEGANKSLGELAVGSRHNPKSNHWGMQIGGAAMALLAIEGDPGTDMAKLTPLIEGNKKAMTRKLSEGYGDGGYFKEGDGTGSMGNIAFTAGLQAWKAAGGLDYYTPRPNAQWLTLRWFHLTVPEAGNDKIQDGFWPIRGGYPHNAWSTMHAYFTFGFGNATADQSAAMLWFYNHSGVKDVYEKRGGPFDTSSIYPHVAILSFINWPVGMAEKNPQGIIPNAVYDSQYKFYAWRNRWKDANDTVVSYITAKVHGGDEHPGVVCIRSQAKNLTWATIPGGFKDGFAPTKDGSTMLTTAGDESFAVDFSQASGAEVMLALTGKAVPGSTTVSAGGTTINLLFLGAAAPPTPVVNGNQVVVGKQTISIAGKKLILSVFGP